MSSLPATVAEFNAVSDRDSRLAVELAVQLRPTSEILQTYGISRQDLIRKFKDPMFKDMVKQAKSLWKSDLSVKERIRLKSQVLVEDSLLEIFSMIHNPENALPAKLDAFKQLARVAEVEQPDRKQGDTGTRFTVAINLGSPEERVVINGDDDA